MPESAIHTVTMNNLAKLQECCDADTALALCRELNRMAQDTYEQEGFKNPRDYLSELVRLYKGIPETFYVHTFLEINRSEND